MLTQEGIDKVDDALFDRVKESASKVVEKLCKKEVRNDNSTIIKDRTDLSRNIADLLDYRDLVFKITEATKEGQDV